MAFVTALTVAGNLTRDVEVRTTGSGRKVASFTIASTPRIFNSETKKYEDGEGIFTNCTLWGEPGENLAASTAKGSRVIATGVLKSRTFQDKEGNNRTAVDLIVEEVGLSLAWTTASANKSGGRRPAAAASADGWPASDDDTPF